jgi:protein arginine kinase
MIIEMEEKARKMLLSSSKNDIIDMCYRAYGVLTNSYMITCEECIELLSKLRFGVVLDLIKLKNPSVIDELYTSIFPAHLMYNYALELSEEEQKIFRAKYVCENLENKIIKGAR